MEPNVTNVNGNFNPKETVIDKLYIDGNDCYHEKDLTEEEKKSYVKVDLSKYISDNGYDSYSEEVEIKENG